MAHRQRTCVRERGCERGCECGVNVGVNVGVNETSERSSETGPRRVWRGTREVSLHSVIFGHLPSTGSLFDDDKIVPFAWTRHLVDNPTYGFESNCWFRIQPLVSNPTVGFESNCWF